MSAPDQTDAIVIGSGPNGLTAAAMLARAGWSVTVLEGNSVVGGAVASEELTVPGYIHDPFPAFYGVLHQSPVFKDLGLDLDKRGNVFADTFKYQTSKEKVFSCGDMRRGQSLVVWAIREGRQCARAIDVALMGTTTLPR